MIIGFLFDFSFRIFFPSLKSVSFAYFVERPSKEELTFFNTSGIEF